MTNEHKSEWDSWNEYLRTPSSQFKLKHGASYSTKDSEGYLEFETKLGKCTEPYGYENKYGEE